MIRQAVLANGAAALGVEHVDRRGVDGARRPCLAGGGDHVPGADRVHLLEGRWIGEPLLEQPHAVEHALGARGSLANGAGIGHVAVRELDLPGEQIARLVDIANEGDHLVAALDQAARHRVPDLSGRAGDQEASSTQHNRARCASTSRGGR